MRQLTNPHDRPVTYAEADNFARVMQTLAHPTRIQILSMLLASPDGVRPVQLMNDLSLFQAGLSWHLRPLVGEGFAVCEKRGRPYRAVPDALRYVADLLGGPR
jgi:ArsR family transcriptional regulator